MTSDDRRVAFFVPVRAVLSSISPAAAVSERCTPDASGHRPARTHAPARAARAPEPQKRASTPVPQGDLPKAASVTGSH